MRFILFILLSSTLSYSQLLDGEISIMYSGEQLFHPGFKIAIDHDLYVKTKTKGKKEKQTADSPYRMSIEDIEKAIKIISSSGFAAADAKRRVKQTLSENPDISDVSELVRHALAQEE